MVWKLGHYEISRDLNVLSKINLSVMKYESNLKAKFIFMLDKKHIYTYTHFLTS